MKKKTTTKKVVKRVTKAQREAIELQKELDEVCSWKSVSGEKVLRLYALNIYTSDAVDDQLCVVLCDRRTITVTRRCITLL